MTPLQQAAAGVHELFSAYLEAGFSRPEALQLVAAHIATNAGGAES